MMQFIIVLFFLMLDRQPVVAQDSNILHPIAEIEQKLQHEPFEIFRMRDVRFEGDVPKRVIVKWRDGIRMQLKWKPAPRDGWAVNNEPRYEVAAYRLQKLFLEPDAYVVPPTCVRSWPLPQYHKVDPEAVPTFKNTNSVLFVLQYWLEKVTSEKVYDKSKAKSDTAYAAHLANMNILSYLVAHKDSNIGNFLVSADPENPRVFVVDNSLAFLSPESDRGKYWQKIRVKRIPEETVVKLRKIERRDLEHALGVVAQFKIEKTQVLFTEVGENLDPNKGVRRKHDTIQFGLTKHEIDDVEDRLKSLIKKIDKDKIKIF